MIDWQGIRATLAGAMASAGMTTEVTLLRTEPGAYDPILDVTTPEQETTYTVAGTILSPGEDEVANMPDDLTTVRMIKVIMPAEGMTIEPRLGDRIRVPGDPMTYTVRVPKAVRPTGIALVHSVIATTGQG